jgi:2-octaprenyl-6-methoxyphenol hydroxylase
VTRRAEIVVAGGGPVGLLAAHAFARMGAESLVLETRPDDAPPNRGDARRIVLAERARRLLETLGLWSAVASETAPVRRVVVRAPSLGPPLVLDAHDYGLEALGWTLGYDALVRALRGAVAQGPRVSLCTGTRLLAATDGPHDLELRAAGPRGEDILHAELLLAAEGAGADLAALGWAPEPPREARDCAWIVPCRTHGLEPGTAVEAFLDGGTATLLATALGRAVVTVVRPEVRERRESGRGTEERLLRLAPAFGLAPETLAPDGEGVTIRVRRGLRGRACASRRLAIGSSFHALHPFAAQGLLLAWRDAAAAARTLGARRARGLPWTSEPVLSEFVRSRRSEHRRLDVFVHRLPPLLSAPGAFLGSPLWRLATQPPLRRLVGYWGMGYGWGRT